MVAETSSAISSPIKTLVVLVQENRSFDHMLAAANDDHPSHDVSEGQKLVKEIYEALRSSPQWNEILFLVIYDEHGGFYDHVPTPTGVPSKDDIVGPEPYNFKFDRLGSRVPAIMVSPWIERGTVLHRPSGPDPTSEFEHSSIAATVKKIFTLKEFLTKRDAWAGSFDIVVNRSSPRTDCPEELVQAAAALNGDQLKDIYPFKLVDNMTVSTGLEYVEEAFKKFYDDGKKTKEINGAEDSVSADAPTRETTKTFMQKVFSCLEKGELLLEFNLGDPITASSYVDEKLQLISNPSISVDRLVRVYTSSGGIFLVRINLDEGCCVYFCCQINGGNVKRVQKTQSYASAGPAARSMHSSENGDSPLRSPNGDHRHVHFGEVVVLGSRKYNQNDHGGESPREDAEGYPETEHEGKKNSHDSITSDKDYISDASRKGEAPLIMSVST
ncbi:hypothetical protein CRYUN_Cryun09bG0219800 [Craigia yunnanensis]